MRKLLIIDDDIRFRDGLTPIISSYDFEVSESDTCAQALKLMALYRFDFIVVCGKLGDSNANATLKSIRQANMIVPILFVSTGPTNDASAAAFKAEHALAGIRSKLSGPDEIAREVVEILRTNLKPKKPTFTFEIKNLDLATSQKTNLPSKPKYTDELDAIMPMGRKNPVNDSMGASGTAGATETRNPELAPILELMQRALHAPDRVDFDVLLGQVAAMKVHAEKTGRTNTALLMKRIQTYLNLFLNAIETDSLDSFEILIAELRREEN